jgi:UDP-N-acetylmuramate: L-alanyl-gamma-D-glutamyl-meso-diaminopimelate ligase
LAQVVASLEARGKGAEQPASVDAILKRLVEVAEPGDTIALLSNGAFGGIYARLLAQLAP